MPLAEFFSEAMAVTYSKLAHETHYGQPLAEFFQDCTIIYRDNKAWMRSKVPAAVGTSIFSNFSMACLVLSLYFIHCHPTEKEKKVDQYRKRPVA